MDSFGMIDKGFPAGLKVGRKLFKKLEKLVRLKNYWELILF